MREKNIKELIREYDLNDNKGDVESQISLGWVDWFCEDEELQEKTNVIYDLLKKIKSEKVLSRCGLGIFNVCPADYKIPKFERINISALDRNKFYCVDIMDSRNDYKYEISKFVDNELKGKYNTDYEEEVIDFLEKL